MDTKEFAVWVAEYAYFGFWKKVKNFQLWIDRMNNTGKAKEFWEEYRRIKPKKDYGQEEKQVDDDYKSFSEHNKND